MKFLEKRKRRQDYWSINQIIEETKKNSRIYGQEPTAKEVLKYMIGDNDGWCSGEFVIYRYSKRTKRNIIQRFNMLWFIPMFTISIPLQYLITGDWGINRNSKMGKITERLIGFEY